ncbi:MAG: hypothetical protein KF774_02085 [Planctomyces sp.]|nr:hypothetical protein [Planctomyces sp.]
MAITAFRNFVRGSLAGLLAVAATAGAVAEDAEGVVRIRSLPSAAQTQVPQGTVIRGQSPAWDDAAEPTDGIIPAGHRRREKLEQRAHKDAANCPPAYECPPDAYAYGADCPRSVLSNNCVAHRLRLCSMNHRYKNRMASAYISHCVHRECEEKFNWFRCKFGFFFPSGCCGQGCPPIGHYSMVYPLNPSYADGRDGQVYAAEEYAGPVSVPLAPVVHHQFNYGWGVPSSRLTPISNPIGY